LNVGFSTSSANTATQHEMFNLQESSMIENRAKQFSCLVTIGSSISGNKTMFKENGVCPMPALTL